MLKGQIICTMLRENTDMSKKIQMWTCCTFSLIFGHPEPFWKMQNMWICGGAHNSMLKGWIICTEKTVCASQWKSTLYLKISERIKKTTWRASLKFRPWPQAGLQALCRCLESLEMLENYFLISICRKLVLKKTFKILWTIYDRIE